MTKLWQIQLNHFITVHLQHPIKRLIKANHIRRVPLLRCDGNTVNNVIFVQ